MHSQQRFFTLIRDCICGYLLQKRFQEAYALLHKGCLEKVDGYICNDSDLEIKHLEIRDQMNFSRLSLTVSTNMDKTCLQLIEQKVAKAIFTFY